MVVWCHVPHLWIPWPSTLTLNFCLWAPPAGRCKTGWYRGWFVSTFSCLSYLFFFYLFYSLLTTTLLFHYFLLLRLPFTSSTSYSQDWIYKPACCDSHLASTALRRCGRGSFKRSTVFPKGEDGHCPCDGWSFKHREIFDQLTNVCWNFGLCWIQWFLKNLHQRLAFI